MPFRYIYVHFASLKRTDRRKAHIKHRIITFRGFQKIIFCKNSTNWRFKVNSCIQDDNLGSMLCKYHRKYCNSSDLLNVQICPLNSPLHEDVTVFLPVAIATHI